jgi:hypothetical protein
MQIQTSTSLGDSVAMMRPDLRNRLLATARDDFSVETGVTPVTGVTAPGSYGSKSLQLQELRELRAEKQDQATDESICVTAAVTHPVDVEDAIEERFEMIDGDGTSPSPSTSGVVLIVSPSRTHTGPCQTSRWATRAATALPQKAAASRGSRGFRDGHNRPRTLFRARRKPV